MTSAHLDRKTLLVVVEEREDDPCSLRQGNRSPDFVSCH